MNNLHDGYERLAAADSAFARQDWGKAIDLWKSIPLSTLQEADARRVSRKISEAYRRVGEFELAGKAMREYLAIFPNDSAARRELRKIASSLSAIGSSNSYWNNRKDYIYYVVLEKISKKIAANARSILDIGSNGTPLLSWFPDVEIKHSVDLHRPYEAPDVQSFHSNFLEWVPERKRYDVALCFQVLEHVPSAAEFAQKILSISDIAIISVPYEWAEDRNIYHVHDPVDRKKLYSWFKREPNFEYIVSEFTGDQRIICVFDRRNNNKWRTISHDQFMFRWRLKGAEEILGADFDYSLGE